MVGQITSYEEHVGELTERIALMEEELRRVRADACPLSSGPAPSKPRPVLRR